MKKTDVNKKRLTGAVLTAVFSALLCVLSPLTLPLFGVPLTLAVFAVCCISTVLGKKGVTSVLLYIVIGAVGLPVFAAFTGGIGVLTGPTGGFILGYIPIALLCGYSSEKQKNIYASVGLSLLGLLICYIAGAGVYIYVTKTPLLQGLTVSVFPFIIPDIIKIIAGVFCGRKIKALLQKSA